MKLTDRHALELLFAIWPRCNVSGCRSLNERAGLAVCFTPDCARLCKTCSGKWRETSPDLKQWRVTSPFAIFEDDAVKLVVEVIGENTDNDMASKLPDEVVAALQSLREEPTE